MIYTKDGKSMAHVDTRAGTQKDFKRVFKKLKYIYYTHIIYWLGVYNVRIYL